MKKQLFETKFDLRWSVGGFVLIFIVIACRCESTLFSSYLWAEDGNVFINRVLLDGWKAIFMPYAGYLHILPSTLTWVAVALSKIFVGGISAVPLIMRILALCMAALSVSYICSEKLSWISKSRCKRLIGYVLLAAIGGSGSWEIFHNIKTIQW